MRLWLVASVCSYGGLQGTGNQDYCAVAAQGVPMQNEIRAGLAGGLLVSVGSVFMLVRTLQSSMAQTALPIISI